MTVATLWKDLEAAETPDGEGYVKRRLRPELALNIFVAIARPVSRRCLLLQVPVTEIRSLPRFAGTRGIQSKVITQQLGAEAFIELSLIDHRFDGFFDHLLDDLLEALPPGVPASDATGLVLARLVRWQTFLRSRPDGLGSEEQRGLYGELWLLDAHLVPGRGPQAVSGWTGPARDAQDFRYDRLAIEVKTCIAGPDQHLRVSSERQLDDTGVDRLFLYHLSLDVRAGVTSTLPLLVAHLRGRLGGGPWSDSFEDRLAAAGYADADAEQYEQTSYTSREENLFRVEGGFPRLTEDVLPAGVGDVQYSITVSSCRPYSVALAEIAPKA